MHVAQLRHTDLHRISEPGGSAVRWRLNWAWWRKMAGGLADLTSDGLRLNAAFLASARVLVREPKVTVH